MINKEQLLKEMEEHGKEAHALLFHYIKVTEALTNYIYNKVDMDLDPNVLQSILTNICLIPSESRQLDIAYKKLRDKLKDNLEDPEKLEHYTVIQKEITDKRHAEIIDYILKNTKSF